MLSAVQTGLGIVILMTALSVSHQNVNITSAKIIAAPREPERASHLSVTALFSQARADAAQEPLDLFTEIMTPLKDEAARRRAQRALDDPDFYTRIDPALNQARINFLFFGYGETYEPPYGPDFKGSINIFSLDLRTLTVSTITLNHDIRAPEVERYRQSTDRKQGPTKIDQAYPIGGFDVMRLTVEDATALSVDFQLAMEDGVIKRAIDEVFGGLEVDAPFVFDALPVYFNGVKYPAYHYPQGRQVLDGLHAVQYIKAVYEGPYDPTKELAVRKQIVIKAMLERVRKESANPIFWTKALTFLHDELERKTIVYDFDPTTLLLRSIQRYVANLANGTITLPSMGTSLYVVDQRSGDGGVEWVTGSQNPIMQRDVENGVYARDLAFSVPKGSADPYASDLIAQYWTAVRELVRRKLAP